VANQIRAILAEAICTRLSDPRLSPFTSITRVDVSPDFAVAHVYVSVMEERDARRRLSVQALQSAAGRLRAVLGRGLRTRQIPRLVFHLDESLRRGFETVQIIDRLMGELQPASHVPEQEAQAGSPGHARLAPGRQDAPPEQEGRPA